VNVSQNASLSFNGGSGKQAVSAVLAVNVISGDLDAITTGKLGLMVRGVNSTAASDIDDTDLGLSCFLDGQSLLPQPLNRNSQVLIEAQ